MALVTSQALTVSSQVGKGVEMPGRQRECAQSDSEGSVQLVLGLLVRSVSFSLVSAHVVQSQLGFHIGYSITV